jgi:translation initiation factor IF-3
MGKNRNFNKKEEKKHNINEEIKAREVMLVGDNVERDTYSRNEALRIAEEMELDLVEMSVTRDGLPICKVMDYKKFLFNQKKNQKAPDKVVTKEIRFKPFKVKLDCLFVGRGWENKRDLILQRTYKLLDEVSEVGLPEQMPKIRGKKMICIIKPNKK